MMKKRIGIWLAAFSLILGACSVGLVSEPPEPARGEEPVPSDGAQGAASPESSAPAPGADGREGSAAAPETSSDEVSGGQMEPVLPGSPSSVPAETAPKVLGLSPSEGAAQQGKERAGESLLRGRDVTLYDWQWIDKDRMLLGVGYGSEKPAFRAVLYNRRDNTAQELYKSEAAADEVRSTYYDDSAEIIAGDKILSYQKPGGAELKVLEAPDHSNVFPEDVDYEYYDIRISSNSRYYIYERAPNGYTYEGKPMSDRVIVDTPENTTTKIPLHEISFPFDVRVSPKTIRWMAGTDRLLADVLLPVEGSYGDFTRRMYVIDAPTGRFAEEFTPPVERPEELAVRDTQDTKILFERPGEPYELIVYDYKTGRQQVVARLEGNNIKGSRAKFSLPGDEVALLRSDGNLFPEFYPIGQPDGGN